MLFATAFVLQQLLTFDRSVQEARKLSTWLWAALLAFTAVHCLLNNLVLHSIVFASMILFIGFKTYGTIQGMTNRDRKRRAQQMSRIGAGKLGFKVSIIVKHLTLWVDW